MGHDLDDEELEATRNKFYNLKKENEKLKKEIEELKKENDEIWGHLPRLD